MKILAKLEYLSRKRIKRLTMDYWINPTNISVPTLLLAGYKQPSSYIIIQCKIQCANYQSRCKYFYDCQPSDSLVSIMPGINPEAGRMIISAFFHAQNWLQYFSPERWLYIDNTMLKFENDLLINMNMVTYHSSHWQSDIISLYSSPCLGERG